jgi:hypothetical protein
MKRITFLTIVLALVMTGFAAHPAQAQKDGRVPLNQVRDVTNAYHQVSVAQAAGYNLVPGLDYCFDNPGVGGMGYHYINVALLDTVDPLKSALVMRPSERSG